MRARRRGVVRAAALGLGSAALAVVTVLPSAAANVPGPAVAAPTAPTVVARDATGGIAAPAKLEVERYLRSLGIDPRGVVIQRGSKNYAGPNCPGPQWNCTTATKVVQLSPGRTGNGADDDENRFVCRKQRGTGGVITKDETPPEQSCFILQPGGSSNSATCDIRTFGSTGTIEQTCFITQGGASNNAVARLFARMGSSGGDQNVRQRIEIKQTGGSAGNTLNASETTALVVGGTTALGVGGNAGGAPSAASQDFNQIICGNQTASGNGRNTATVNQQGRAAASFSNAGDVYIDQNRDVMSSECTEDSPGDPVGPGAAPFADATTSCAVAGGSGSPKLDANTCSRIQQVAASGKNQITRQDQANLLFAAVDGASNVRIRQGTFTGGIDSTQNQQSDGSTTSSIVDAQAVDQVVSVKDATGSVFVTEIEDPRCCSVQIGSPSDTWSLTQRVSQKVLVDEVLVNPVGFSGGAIAQRAAVYGQCVTTGTCTVSQRASNNVDDESNSCSGSICDVFVECVAGGTSLPVVAHRPSRPARIQDGGGCFPGGGVD
jgi:hypothetical protein